MRYLHIMIVENDEEDKVFCDELTKKRVSYLVKD
jgi:hypothetical protein